MSELKIKVRRGGPTIKQIKALQNINQGMSVRKSMIQAGYSIKSANKSTAFFKNKKVQNAILGLKGQIENIGINNVKISLKFQEWLDATKPFSSHTEPDKEIPDYDTQIKAYDRIKDIWDQAENPAGNVKRKLTIEEFVNDEPIKLEEVKEVKEIA